MSKRVLRYLQESGETDPGPLAMRILASLPRTVTQGARAPTLLAVAHYFAQLIEGAPTTQKEAASGYGVIQQTLSLYIQRAKKRVPEIEEALKLGRKHRALLKDIQSLEERLRHWQRQNREAERRMPKLRDRLQRLHRQREKLLATNPFT